MTNLENLLSSDRETGFNKCVQFQITTNSTVTYNIHSGEFCLNVSHPYYKMKWCTVLTRIVTIFFRLFFLLFIFLIFGFFLFFRWRNGNVWRRRGAITLPFRRIDANLIIATKKDCSDTTISILLPLSKPNQFNMENQWRLLRWKPHLFFPMCFGCIKNDKNRSTFHVGCHRYMMHAKRKKSFIYSWAHSLKDWNKSWCWEIFPWAIITRLHIGMHGIIKNKFIIIRCACQKVTEFYIGSKMLR